MDTFEEVISKKNKKDDYYSVDAISNTSIGYFLESPLLYKKLRDSGITETTSSMDLGSAIHAYILEPEIFNDRYAICKHKITGKMGIYVEAYVDVIITGISDDVAHEIAYQKAEFIPKNIKPETVINNFNEYKTKSYIDFLKSSIGKTILSSEEFDIVQACKVSVMANKAAKKLLTNSPLLTAYNEIEIYWKSQLSLNLKSKLDRVVIDWGNKVIYIPDLKTTGKPLKDFKNAVKIYHYHRQLAFYTRAVKWLMNNDKRFNGTQDFRIQPLIIAVETTRYNECRVFEISKYDLNKGTEEFNNVLAHIAELTRLGAWDYTLEYQEGDGIEQLGEIFNEGENSEGDERKSTSNNKTNKSN